MSGPSSEIVSDILSVFSEEQTRNLSTFIDSAKRKGVNFKITLRVQADGFEQSFEGSCNNPPPLASAVAECGRATATGQACLPHLPVVAAPGPADASQHQVDVFEAALAVPAPAATDEAPRQQGSLKRPRNASEAGGNRNRITDRLEDLPELLRKKLGDCDTNKKPSGYKHVLVPRGSASSTKECYCVQLQVGPSKEMKHIATVDDARVGALLAFAAKTDLALVDSSTVRDWLERMKEGDHAVQEWFTSATASPTTIVGVSEAGIVGVSEAGFIDEVD